MIFSRNLFQTKAHTPPSPSPPPPPQPLTPLTSTLHAIYPSCYCLLIFPVLKLTMWSLIYMQFRLAVAASPSPPNTHRCTMTCVCICTHTHTVDSLCTYSCIIIVSQYYVSILKNAVQLTVVTCLHLCCAYICLLSHWVTDWCISRLVKIFLCVFDVKKGDIFSRY